VSTQIQYDAYGRMKFNPEIHTSHKTPWTTVDENYLIKYYRKISAAELSLALGRTIGVIHDRIYRMKKAGTLK